MQLLHRQRRLLPPLRGPGADLSDDPDSFQEVRPPERKQVGSLPELQAYLASVTLEELLAQLKAHGVTQKAFAEGIGMNPRHLTAIKSSELRNHFFNELGATTGVLVGDGAWREAVNVMIMDRLIGATTIAHVGP